MVPPPASVRRGIVAPPSRDSSHFATAGCHFARAPTPPIMVHAVCAGTARLVDMLTFAIACLRASAQDARPRPYRALGAGKRGLAVPRPACRPAAESLVSPPNARKIRPAAHVRRLETFPP